MRCDQCKWWSLLDEQSYIHFRGAGYCLRFPPVIIQSEDSEEELYEWYGEWPKTHGKEWCGEFKKKAIGLSLSGMGNRVCKAVTLLGVTTIDEFLELSTLDILRCKGIGEVTLCQIESAQRAIAGIPEPSPTERLMAEEALKAALGL